jgi:hypothetical protein
MNTNRNRLAPPDAIGDQRHANSGAFHGRHTIHFYLAMSALCAALGTCAVNLRAYYDEGKLITEVGFWLAVVTAAILLATWFWGTFLAMSGTLPRRRILYLALHATFGSILPLIYILHVGSQVDSVGSQPIGEGEVELDLAGLALLLIQIGSGWSVLRRPAWVWLTRLLAGEHVEG